MKCEKKNCTSDEPAKCEPVLLIWAKGHRPGTHAPISVNLNLKICQACTKTSSKSDFVDFKMWQNIYTHVIGQGKSPPDFLTSQMTYVEAETYDRDMKEALFT